MGRQMTQQGRAMALRRLLFGPCRLDQMPDPVSNMDVRWLVNETYAEYVRDTRYGAAHSVELGKDFGDEFDMALKFIQRVEEMDSPTILDEDVQFLLSGAG